jgi:hypothetical protein
MTMRPVLLGQETRRKEPRTVFAPKTPGLGAPSPLFYVMSIVQETRLEFPPTLGTLERPIGFQVFETIVLLQGLGDGIGGSIGTQRALVPVNRLPMGNTGLDAGEGHDTENAGDEGCHGDRRVSEVDQSFLPMSLQVTAAYLLAMTSAFDDAEVTDLERKLRSCEILVEKIKDGDRATELIRCAARSGLSWTRCWPEGTRGELQERVRRLQVFLDSLAPLVN